jgi:hypothetical protein
VKIRALQKWLLELCEQPIKSKAYYRPFLCRDAVNIQLSKIFIVGINQATPILNTQLSLEKYVELLSNYDNFMTYYKNERISLNKSPISKTRNTIIELTTQLINKYKTPIVETNIICYPTPSLKLLLQEPTEIINRGKEIFKEVYLKIKPEILIIHGDYAYEHLDKQLVKNSCIVKCEHLSKIDNNEIKRIIG